MAQYEECDCDVCNVQLNSKTVRFHCADEACEDDWDLCVECFSRGATKPGTKHKPWHAYRIIAPVERPLFAPDWSGDEELSLLQGSEKFGLGNWSDVAEFVGNRRTKEECDAHYTTTYLRSRKYPLPDIDANIPYEPEIFQTRKRRRIADRAALQKLPPPSKSKPITSTPSCHEVQGYMPGRLEFEHEYENEAEMSVKDLEFDQDLAENADDEVQFKLTILDIYNSRLTRRADRKRVIFEHGALNFKHNQAVDKKRSKEERDLLLRTRPFARLLNSHDFELFSEGLLNESILRKRVAELQEWRRMGLITLEQGPRYEKDKQHRLLMRSSSTNNSNAGARYTKPLEPKKLGNPTLSQSTDVQLLSREEQSLCSNLKMLPKAYLSIKEALIRELIRTGGALSKKSCRGLLKVDPNKTAKIYEYLTQFKLMTS
ncbi:Transcriptional adapter 2 [Taphrina deformans PYCC 5710]|uniref:Transcriptional adapter 2 n=1 Tax=Taphrina deformans (strain PYCC 5710 / ATCC 11124 / CBS 356.35 / IMI 108563 / JCM 9778 / NBRC 8474) TaxID=1097556 RepID=R4X787_TAPDE|nr:Transcriptional adapter 2 [Taphrina deformans PYCC 5710]|eukprot:CCG80928.1 Transcriptional adapter 2 [Taphrina deformans PYCC 5710]